MPGQLKNVWSAALMAVVIASTELLAQSTGGDFRIDPELVSGSGGLIVGGEFRATATFGQPATDVLTSSSIRLQGGFWPAAGPFDRIFANGFQP